MVEAVGWNHTVEEEKGRRVMESLREVFADGAMQVWRIEYAHCREKGCIWFYHVQVVQINVPNVYPAIAILRPL